MVIAPRLLGATLISDVDGHRVAVRITEVEAYAGADDPASHAARGVTARNAVMFGPAGRLYVYFSYGMHWCANVVCGSDGEPGAILLRAGEVTEGVHWAGLRRPAARRSADLARGPARLAAALGLDGRLDGLDLCDHSSLVRLTDLRARRPARTVSGPRVGISVATERAWRFWLDGDSTVSAYRAGRPRAAGRRPAH